MTPTITSATIVSKENQHLNIKLRKLMVEKMRRDRINTSIEQLKSLLAPEFLKQQSDSRLEKADILEMTVGFLKRQQRHASSSSLAAVGQGFSRCVHETVNFLSKQELKTQSQKKLLNHIQNLQPSLDDDTSENVVPQLSSTEHQIISKGKSSAEFCYEPLWRPWLRTSS